MNCSSASLEHASPPEKNRRQAQKRQRQQQRKLAAFTATSQPPTHYLSLLTGINQEPGNSHKIPKRPRVDVQEEDILHQQIIQQLQRKDSLQLQGHNPHLQAWIQQHGMQNQQQQKILQSKQQMQGADMQQQLHQIRNQPQQGRYEVPVVQNSDTGICSRRLMQYLYHQRHRPLDNAISYWRKFVTEYYAPFAKKRWCLSLYNNVGCHAVGVLPQAAMDTWHCDICGSRSGRGFEAMFEVLPRLHKINFESGVIDELLFLDLPRESRFSSGLVLLEYGKAVQESVYEQLRIIREGQLRIIFTHDLKILSWEFCIRHHEELLPSRVVAPQVNQLVHSAQRYRNAMDGSKSSEFCAKDLQATCDMFLRAGHQLTRNLELQLVDDLGFSRRYVRYLQMAEVVHRMEDLMIFVRDSNIGPMEGLKKYSQEATRARSRRKQLQRGELVPEWGQDSSVAASRLMKNSEEGALALTSRHPKIMQQSSFVPNSSRVKQESCTFDSFGLCSSSSSIQNHPQANSSSSAHSSQGNQNKEQCLIQKLIEEMINNNRGKGDETKEEILCGISSTTRIAPALLPPSRVVGRDKRSKADASSSKGCGPGKHN